MDALIPNIFSLSLVLRDSLDTSCLDTTSKELVEPRTECTKAGDDGMLGVLLDNVADVVVGILDFLVDGGRGVIHGRWRERSRS